MLVWHEQWVGESAHHLPRRAAEPLRSGDWAQWSSEARAAASMPNKAPRAADANVVPDTTHDSNEPVAANWCNATRIAFASSYSSVSSHMYAHVVNEAKCFFWSHTGS